MITRYQSHQTVARLLGVMPILLIALRSGAQTVADPLEARSPVALSAVSDGRGQDSARLKEKVEVRPTRCGASPEQPERIFTVNGAVRPEIPIADGERQFWRIVNASPDLYADLEVDGEQLEIVALDGMVLAYHDPVHRTRRASHVLLPPAGRVEVIVTGRPGRGAKLRTLCFDTGSDGDPNPAMVLADLVDAREEAPTRRASRAEGGRAISRVLSRAELARIEGRAPEFTAVFTEHDHGFYINGRRYNPADAPMTRVRVGGYHYWRVVNATREAHPFHIHQVHFLVYATNEGAAREPEWRDTVNVPPGGSVDLLMDFTDPIIRGMSLFHCHLLSHEDKGMMATILFE
jgi:suppressor of ftsI